MNLRFPSLFSRRPNRRALLLDLHACGLISVFRRPSIFRLWEPLRERPARNESFSD